MFWGSNEQSNTHGNLSWGSKVGQIRSYGTSYMILIACFQRFFFIFRIFFTPPPQKKKYHFPSDIFEDYFSIKQDTFLILKLLIKFLKELVLGQGSFSAKCTGLCVHFPRGLDVEPLSRCTLCVCMEGAVFPQITPFIFIYFLFFFFGGRGWG